MRAVIVLKWMSQAQSTVISVWWLEGKLLVVACYGFSDKGTLLILARSSGLWSPLVTITPSSACLGHTALLSQEYEAQKLGGHNCALYSNYFVDDLLYKDWNFLCSVFFFFWQKISKHQRRRMRSISSFIYIDEAGRRSWHKTCWLTLLTPADRSWPPTWSGGNISSSLWHSLLWPGVVREGGNHFESFRISSFVSFEKIWRQLHSQNIRRCLQSYCYLQNKFFKAEIRAIRAVLLFYLPSLWTNKTTGKLHKTG